MKENKSEARGRNKPAWLPAVLVAALSLSIGVAGAPEAPADSGAQTASVTILVDGMMKSRSGAT